MSKLEPYYENPEFGVTLFRGGCLEIMPTLAPGSVDMVAADLPYGTTACKWDTVIPFEPLWACYRRVTKPNAAIVLTASQPFTSALVMSNVKWFRYQWTWVRGNKASGHLDAKRRPLRKHESVLVFYRSQPIYNPVMRPGPQRKASAGGDTAASELFRPGLTRKPWASAQRYPVDILEINAPDARQREHPTQKPVALMEYLIRTYTNEGDTVLDNTFGSGTTAVACVNTRRKFVGMELDADGKGYCQTAVERIEKAIAERAKPRQLEIAV